ncbi:MAG: prolipoprotein diacylglyceryl transferase family protein [Spirosomataceae bacterium]
MHFPVTIPIGDHQVHLHFICEVLAYSIGFRYYLYIRRHSNDLISDEQRLWIFLGATAGGFFGGHLLGILENPSDWSSMTWRSFPFYFMGNKTVVGGFLGGLIGVELTKKMLKVTTSSGDMMVFPLLLGNIIGRIGCFLEGIHDGTHGTASNLPWAIDFGDGIRRHPAPLYEILFLVVWWIGIVQLERRFTLTNGSRFKIYLVGYLLFRFTSEFIKPVYFLEIGLSVIQVACLSGLLYYWKVFAKPQQLIALRN